jgi:hypothetical protein
VVLPAEPELYRAASANPEDTALILSGGSIPKEERILTLPNDVLSALKEAGRVTLEGNVWMGREHGWVKVG